MQIIFFFSFLASKTLLVIPLVTSPHKESQHKVELNIFRAQRNTLNSLYSYMFMACIQTWLVFKQVGEAQGNEMGKIQISQYWMIQKSFVEWYNFSSWYSQKCILGARLETFQCRRVTKVWRALKIKKGVSVKKFFQ